DWHANRLEEAMRVESVVWDEWYPVAIVDDLIPDKRYTTKLLGHDIEYVVTTGGTLSAWRAQDSTVACRTQTRYHTHWVSLGAPEGPFFDLPEFAEPDRRVVGSGSMAV